MPFTARQAKSVLNSRGQAFIKAHDLPRAQRIAEMYLRRKIYSLEDITVRRHYDLLKSTYARIQDIALRSAPDKLDMQAQGWRKQVLNALEQALRNAVISIAQEAYFASQQAYRAGYLGRLWGMESSLKPDAPLNKAYRSPVLPVLSDFAEPYAIEIDLFLIKAKRLMTAALSQGLTPRQVMRQVAIALGVDNQRATGAFGRLQAVTRSKIIQQFAVGSVNATLAQMRTDRHLEAEEAPYNIVQGIMWVSSRDSRTCFFCSRMDGTIYTARDLERLTLVDLPPERSHLHCRCNMVAVLTKEYIQPGDLPPKETLKEWLEYNNYYDVLMQTFIKDTFMASSQIEEPTS